MNTQKESSISYSTTDHRQLQSLYGVVAIDLRAIFDYREDEFKELAQELIEESYAIQKRAKSLTEEINANNVMALKSKRAALVLQIREAESKLSTMLSAQARYDQNARSLNERVNKAHNELTALRDSPPRPEVSLDEDFIEYEKEVAAKTAAVEKASNAVQANGAEYQMWANAYNRQETVLAGLKNEQSDLLFRIEKLSGKNPAPRVSRETGLPL